jgi:hypothetical protein
MNDDKTDTFVDPDIQHALLEMTSEPGRLLAASRKSPSDISQECPPLSVFCALGPQEIRMFWVCAAEELDELCPAEVLAGRPMASRDAFDEPQMRLLTLPLTIRLEKIRALAVYYIHQRDLIA